VLVQLLKADAERFTQLLERKIGGRPEASKIATRKGVKEVPIGRVIARYERSLSFDKERTSILLRYASSLRITDHPTNAERPCWLR
jgi:hypothetical protein